MNTKLVLKGDAPEQHLVFGEIYAPSTPDAQGEFMRADEIQKMAHNFVRDKKTDQVDVMHDNVVVKCNVVESFIARKGDPDFIEGAWVVCMHIPDDGLWNQIKKGEINGFSMEALVTRHDQQCDIEMPPVVQGMTSKGDDGHEHTFFVSYADDGTFRGGTTNMVNGHSHRILAGTHTEKKDNHSHRFSSVDDVRVM